MRKYKSIRYFISPSKFLKNKLVNAGFSKDKIVYLPNFIKAEDFEPSFGSGEYILFVGRLSKEKGLITLLRAVGDIDLPVKIVGDGPMRSEVERFVREKGIENVTFKGYCSGKALSELFKKCAFLVFPSEWYENAPMTILEAFAYGKPVIGANIGGIPEMVLDHKTGLLFESGNHLDLREKITYLLSLPSLAIEMGKNARQRVEQEYNADVHYQSLIDVYKRALN